MEKVSMDLDNSLDFSVGNTTTDDFIKTHMSVNNNPDGILGNLVNLVRSIDSFTQEGVEHLVRLAFCVGFSESGIDMAELMKGSAEDLASKANQYASFVADKLCETNSISKEDYERIMSETGGIDE